jgi:hypothetical protein
MPYFDFTIFVTKVFEPPLIITIPDQVHTVRHLFFSLSLYVTVIVTYNQGIINAEVQIEKYKTERHLRLPRNKLKKEFVCKDLGIKILITVNCCNELDRNSFYEYNKRELLTNSVFRIPPHCFDPFSVRPESTTDFSITWINSKYNLTIDVKLLYFPVTLR